MEAQKTQNSQKNPELKKKYYRATVIETASYYWHKNRYVGIE
jgi:hypothetical protein